MEGFSSISQSARIVLVLIMRSSVCYSVDREHRHITALEGSVRTYMQFYKRPVDSKDGHKRTSSHYLTYANPTTCATGYLIQEEKDIFEFCKMLLNYYYRPIHTNLGSCDLHKILTIILSCISFFEHSLNKKMVIFYMPAK